MAHLLIITGGLMGLVNPACAVATRLRHAGHRVTYASPASIEPVITARGLPFHQLPPCTEHWTDGRRPLGRLLHAPARRRAALDALGVDRLVEDVARLEPDAVLVELERHAHVMSLVAAGVRVGLLSPFISIHEQPRVPPLHLSLIPSPGPAGEDQVREAWRSYRRWKRRTARRRRWRGLGVSHETTLRRHARRVGFDVRAELEEDQWLLPFSYRHLPLFMMQAYDMDFPHEPRANVHHLGPMVDPDRAEAPMSPEDEARLDRVVPGRDGSRTGAGADAERRRMVLVSLSTAVQGRTAFIRRVVDAVADRSGLDVLIGLGGRFDPRDLPTLPPHVHAFAYLPQMRVLRHADAAIVTAGSSTMAECVLHRVPMVIHSLGKNDQDGNAARVVHHGLGVAGRLDDEPGTIARHLDRVLGDAGMAQRIEAMRERLLAIEAEETCARGIERLLDLPRPEPA